MKSITRLFNMFVFFTICVLCLMIATLSTAHAKYKVAVIDGPLLHNQHMIMSLGLCKNGHYDFTRKKPVVAVRRHSDNHSYYVSSLIQNTSKRKDVCIMLYNILGKHTKPGDLTKAIELAVKNKAKAINISLVAPFRVLRKESHNGSSSPGN